MEAIDVWMVDYMQMFNIPELHLLLGVGQKLYDAIVATMSEEELATHELLLKHNNISRGSYHGGAFEGNAMRKITLMVEQIGFPISNSSYIALKRFSEVGGHVLDNRYKVITNWRYFNLKKHSN